MAFSALTLCAGSSSHSDRGRPGIYCFISLSISRTGTADNKTVGRPLGMGSQLVRASMLERNGNLMKLSHQRQPIDCYPEDCCLKEEVPPPDISGRVRHGDKAAQWGSFCSTFRSKYSSCGGWELTITSCLTAALTKYEQNHYQIFLPLSITHGP